MGAAHALGLDAQALAQCMAEPETAVDVLDDTAEALRLGFREAVPSWVIGARPRRGFQNQDVIDRDVDEQLAARQADTAPDPVTGTPVPGSDARANIAPADRLTTNVTSMGAGGVDGEPRPLPPQP